MEKDILPTLPRSRKMEVKGRILSSVRNQRNPGINFLVVSVITSHSPVDLISTFTTASATSVEVSNNSSKEKNATFVDLNARKCQI